jgi:hypothetical protein
MCANDAINSIDYLGLDRWRLPFFYTCPTLADGGGFFTCTGQVQLRMRCPSPKLIPCLKDAINAMNLGCVLSDAELFDLGCKSADVCLRAWW